VHADLDHLEFQKLLERHDRRYVIAEHLREVI
jgi:hypothetical protein